MTRDYKNSHDVLLNHQKWRKGCDFTPPTNSKQLSEAIDDALYALKLAEKVTGEPSEGMVDVYDNDFARSISENFKAMITQAQKEIEDEVR